MSKHIDPENLMAKLEVANVGFHRYNENKNIHSLFCFMEGRHDPDYYMGVIRSICGDDVVTINCGSKQNVIDIYSRVYPSDHNQYRLAFFVDRDFDQLINDSNIFETDRYSIENYYCSQDVFERILKYELNISEDESCWNDVITFFQKEFETFHETVDLFNAFYSILHKYERNNNVFFKLKLGDNFPKELADIKVGGCKKKYNLQDLLNKYELETNIMTEDEVEDERLRLWSLNPYFVFRGKYEIDFMYKLLLHLITNANKNNKTDSIIKKSISFGLNGEHFMSNIAQHADIPNSLREYLQRFRQI